jgi:hypothetical protein
MSVIGFDGERSITLVPIHLLRKSRKTERGAKRFVTGLAVAPHPLRV